MPTAKVSYDVSPRSREMQPSKRSDCARIIHLSNVTSIEEQWRKKAVVAQREAELNKALADKYRRESEDLRSMLARHGIEAPSSSASCSIKDAVLKHGISHTVQTCAAALGHLGASERRGLYAPQQPVWVRDTPCSAAALGHTLAALSEAGCRDAIALLDDAACAATRDIDACDNQDDPWGSLFWLSWTCSVLGISQRWPAVAAMSQRSEGRRSSLSQVVRRISGGGVGAEEAVGHRSVQEAMGSVVQAALGALAKDFTRRHSSAMAHRFPDPAKIEPIEAAGAAVHLCQDGISALLWSARAARLPTLALGMVLSHVAALCDHAIHARLSQISNNAPVLTELGKAVAAMERMVAATTGLRHFSLPFSRAFCEPPGVAATSDLPPTPQFFPPLRSIDTAVLATSVTALARPEDPLPVPGFTEPALPRPLFDFLGVQTSAGHKHKDD